MTEYVSMSDRLLDIVDCRMMQVEFEFYELSQSVLKLLAEQCFLECQALIKDIFFIQWEWNNHRVKEKTLCEKIRTSLSFCDLDFCGDIYSNTVYDSKTFRQYDRLLFDPNSPLLRTIRHNRYESDDYRNWFLEHFSNIHTEEQVKNSLLKLFNEQGKKHLNYWRNHDIVGSLSTFPYNDDPNLYWGEFKMRIPLLCLGSNVNIFSRKTADFVQKIACTFSHVSARVALSPISSPSSCSGHLKHFNGWRENSIPPAAERMCFGRWQEIFYAHGAEWFNIISPLQRSLVPNLLHESSNMDNVCVEQLCGGGISVRSTKEILQTDIPEYTSIKKVMYPALVPGYHEIELKHLMSLTDYWNVKPRRMWEYTPIFSDEIIVDKDHVVFQHNDSRTHQS